MFKKNTSGNRILYIQTYLGFNQINFAKEIGYDHKLYHKYVAAVKKNENKKPVPTLLKALSDYRFKKDGVKYYINMNFIHNGFGDEILPVEQTSNTKETNKVEKPFVSDNTRSGNFEKEFLEALKKNTKAIMLSNNLITQLINK